MNEEIENSLDESKESSVEAVEQSTTIADLYPELTAEQQEEAAYFLNRYLDLIERIYERTYS